MGFRLEVAIQDKSLLRQGILIVVQRLTVGRCDDMQAGDRALSKRTKTASIKLPDAGEKCLPGCDQAVKCAEPPAVVLL